jgi:Tfp pilus assembly protein PilF
MCFTYVNAQKFVTSKLQTSPADKFYNQALECFNNQNYTCAEQNFKESIANTEAANTIKIHDLYINLGTTQVYLSKLKDAITSYKNALKVHEDSLNTAAIAIAEIYENQKEYEKANAELKSIEKRNPKNETAIGKLMMSYAAAQKWNLACAYGKKLWQLNPTDDVAYNLTFFYNMNKQYAECADMATRYLKTPKQNSAPILANKAFALLQLNQLPEAISTATLAIKADNDLYMPYLTRAKAYKANKQANQACADFEKAYTLGFTGEAILQELEQCNKYFKKRKN